LVNKGYLILHRNFRAKQYGEIDIVASHPGRRLLIFVEVKTRIGDEFGRPEAAVTKAKLHELKKMVDYYCNQFPQDKLSPQIDAVAIIMNKDESVNSLEHFANITL
jgi:putative endonuclease